MMQQGGERGRWAKKHPRCTGRGVKGMAERVGFEPTIPRGDTRSPGARTRPDYATSPWYAVMKGGEGGIRTLEGG